MDVALTLVLLQVLRIFGFFDLLLYGLLLVQFLIDKVVFLVCHEQFGNFLLVDLLFLGSRGELFVLSALAVPLATSSTDFSVSVYLDFG